MTREMVNELKVEIPLKVSIESITKAVKKALDNQEIKLNVYIDLQPKVEEKDSLTHYNPMKNESNESVRKRYPQDYHDLTPK